MPNKLLESRWWEGPNWVKLPEEEWLISNVGISEEEVALEMKKNVVINIVQETTPWYA